MEEDMFGTDTDFMQLFETLLKEPYANGPIARLVEPERLSEVLVAKAALEDIIAKSGEDAKVEMHFNPEFGAISLTAEVESLEIRDFTGFSRIFENASNAEFFPLTNGKVSIGLMFYEAFIVLR